MSARVPALDAGELVRRVEPDGFVGLFSPRLAELGLPHVFTTRHLGTERELDLGALDEIARARLSRAAALPGAVLVSVKQVHGAHCLVLRAGELPAPGAEADGLVSERADVLVGVHVADCVPVLVARVDGTRVAAVHAGWRGLVAGVLSRALAELGPGELVAAIGPCLSRDQFEVGPEVSAAFERAGLAHVIARAPGRRDHIDLVAAAASQLRTGGVRALDTSGRCTYAEPDEFYSFRRDVTHGGRARTGRLGAWIAARASAKR